MSKNYYYLPLTRTWNNFLRKIMIKYWTWRIKKWAHWNNSWFLHANKFFAHGDDDWGQEREEGGWGWNGANERENIFTWEGSIPSTTQVQAPAGKVSVIAPSDPGTNSTKNYCIAKAIHSTLAVKNLNLPHSPFNRRPKPIRNSNCSKPNASR